MNPGLISPEAINRYFERLQAVLVITPLPTSTPGKKRSAHASEFMFMQEDANGAVGFKHCNSRNYVFLLKNNQLFVPQKKDAFLRGTFDIDGEFIPPPPRAKATPPPPLQDASLESEFS